MSLESIERIKKSQNVDEAFSTALEDGVFDFGELEEIFTKYKSESEKIYEKFLSNKCDTLTSSKSVLKEFNNEIYEICDKDQLLIIAKKLPEFVFINFKIFKDKPWAKDILIEATKNGPIYVIIYNKIYSNEIYGIDIIDIAKDKEIVFGILKNNPEEIFFYINVYLNNNENWILEILDLIVDKDILFNSAKKYPFNFFELGAKVTKKIGENDFYTRLINKDILVKAANKDILSAIKNFSHFKNEPWAGEVLDLKDSKEILFSELSKNQALVIDLFPFYKNEPWAKDIIVWASDINPYFAFYFFINYNISWENLINTIKNKPLNSLLYIQNYKKSELENILFKLVMKIIIGDNVDEEMLKSNNINLIFSNNDFSDNNLTNFIKIGNAIFHLVHTPEKNDDDGTLKNYKDEDSLEIQIIIKIIQSEIGENKELKEKFYNTLLKYFKENKQINEKFYIIFCKFFDINNNDFFQLLAKKENEKKGEIKIDREKLLIGITKGVEEINNFIRKKSDGLTSKWILGPTLDLTYSTRIGYIVPGVGNGVSGIDDFGYGYTKERLYELKLRFKRLGIPDFNPDTNNNLNDSGSNEIYLASIVNYISKIKTKPNLNFVVKHWPGGSDETETTERQELHYQNKKYIGRQLDLFQEIIKSKNSPSGIMLSHASYDLSNFPGIEKIAKNTLFDDSLSDIPVSQIPASLNPVFVRYLREVQGYKGAIVGDWYNMLAIKKFLDKINIDGFSQQHKAFYLAINAGINFVGGISINSITHKEIWENFKKDNPEKFKIFEDKLNKVFLETFRILNKGKLPESEANKLDFYDKIALLCINVKDNNSLQLIKLRINDNNEKVIQLFIEEGIGNNDIWNRSLVLVLLLRKKIIEEISGKKINIENPTTIDKESEWKDILFSNPTFKKYNESIDWNSTKIQEALNEELQKQLKKIK